MICRELRALSRLRQLQGDLRQSCVSENFVIFFYEVRLCLLGMARVRLTAKGISEGACSTEERDHMSEIKEDLADVDADPSDLMKRDKPESTLRFSPSLISAALIEAYVEKGYFLKGVCRPPQGEETPNPGDYECVVFRDFFVAGLCLPLDPAVPSILARFK